MKAMLISSTIILALTTAILLNASFTSLDKKEFKDSIPEFMGICLEDKVKVRCIGEETKFNESKVIFYQCDDGYTRVTSPFTHICEARRRDFLDDI